MVGGEIVRQALPATASGIQLVFPHQPHRVGGGAPIAPDQLKRLEPCFAKIGFPVRLEKIQQPFPVRFRI